MQITTLHFRIKDSTSGKYLERQSRAVNFVWNYCNEYANKAYGFNRRWLSGFDLNYLTSGVSKDLKLHSQTIQAICEEHATRRKQFRLSKLKWRSKKSLGWVPFKNGFKITGEGQCSFNGKTYRFWQSQDIPSKIRTGSFSQDSKGRWYLNLVVEYTPETNLISGKSVGVDLGLKTTATYSDGDKFDGVKAYRKFEKELAISQRARKKKRVKAIHAKIANIRKDSIHKETTRVVKKYDTIFVGDVSSLKLAKTKMAKSVLDSGWGMYRSFLEYKTIRFGNNMVKTKENYSTVTCSVCLNKTFKSGLSSLGVREWTCNVCGTNHDRDVNAAKNILRVGHDTLLEESPCL